MCVTACVRVCVCVCVCVHVTVCVQVERIREIEIAAMRLEEASKFRKQVGMGGLSWLRRAALFT